ncbi:transglycosylase domain-containing protein [Rhabdothermincola salaria]|uniref:transglycosylase domain-containing protein n=1 Tax=Rhabdothermincola salaria TaxID=2903142 RepID=UPI001E3371A0|nr:transglycosylase domain-containing protein [Rhabdothermincola salaria]MCD9624469.1 penicillin-binding protein [Rhabdothermincola salaria]
MASRSRAADRAPKGRPSRSGGSRAATSKPPKEGTFVWRWRRAWFLMALLFVLGVSGVAYLFTQVPLPDDDPELSQTSFFCASDVTTDCNADNSIAQLSGGIDRVNVEYEDLPQVLVDAVLAAEDKDFYLHSGVDPAGILRALWANVRNQDVQQGGSTITQQYVKNVYLTQERTYTRKIKEAALAVKLERELPKQEILLRYLNTIYFGRGAYGVEAASRSYFGKPVQQLTLPEAAYLAGLIRSPETADANRGPDDPAAPVQAATALRRRDSVLDAMLEAGFASRAEYDAAMATALETVTPRQVPTNFGRVANPEWGTEYFIDHVRQWLVTEGGFSDADVFEGGLRVYTTLDLDMQRAAHEAVVSTLGQPDDPSAALVAIDDVGAVSAMFSGTDFANEKVNLATGTLGGGGGRQPGSSFKTFALAEAVAQGIPLNKTYDAPAKLVIPEANDGEDWEVGNYADAGLGTLDLVSATAKSSNTAYAQLMLEVGPQNVVALAKRMGITAAIDAYPATVLGTEEVSVLDMASAYSTFADGGVHIDPYVVTRVTDASGRVLYENEVQRDQILDQAQVEQVNWALHQVVEGGTGTAAKYDQPAAGKTGTTDNYRDAWFVGYTCRLTAAVWMGYPGVDENGNDRLMENVRGRDVTGGSFPAEIWRKFMVEATRDKDACEFTQPDLAPFVDDEAEEEPVDTTEPPPTTAPETTLPPTTAPPTTAPPTTAPPTTPPPTTVPPTTAPPTTAPPGTGGAGGAGGGNGSNGADERG